MAAIAKVLSQAWTAGNEKSDTLFAVLMFALIGLLISISLLLASGTPLPFDFEIF